MTAKVKLRRSDERRYRVGRPRDRKVINRTPRQAYYLLEQKRLPARCDDGMYSASRQKLLAYVSGSDDKPLDAA